jgi:diguanylate cyclase (GGDEF)-like protein
MKPIRDVTEAYELNQSLRKQAMMDDLSGLYNRRAFVQMGNEIISQATARGELVCLLMMDLDHFKAINDRYGHRTGDFAIMRISRMLRASFIENSLIARLGGEEFGVLINGYTAEQVAAQTARFVATVSGQSYTDQGKTYSMTVSVGVGYLRDAGKDLYGLMLMADKALYRAKEAGRNQMVEYDGV